MAQQLLHRSRRLRSSETLRALVRETHLNLTESILPLFIKEGLEEKKPIATMPGHFQLSLNDLVNETKELQALGIRSVLLFGIPAHKDDYGSQAYASDGIVQRAAQIIKDVAPEMLVISDICCCEYTHHGHCGFIPEDCPKKDVDNDKTLELLAQQAQSHAQAGIDMVAPSGMMDGQVRAIRHSLDEAGHTQVPIMSYSIKYSSCLYGPFREATEGAPQFGDRKTYQMDPSNSKEALREARLDLEEGADMLMVKPALMYLDIIRTIKNTYGEVPLAAYHVSGEYAMIKAAAEKGWLDEQKAMLETLTSIKRAGADIILHYYVKDLAKYLNRF